MANPGELTHKAFLISLFLYFFVVGLVLLLVFDTFPFLLVQMELAPRSGEITQTIVDGLFGVAEGPPSLEYATTSGRIAILGVLSFYFVGTVLLMVPITWVYMHTHPNSYGRSLITALIILPICATATVWLIQDSLPLAFGLAALVAAVRFRIRLDSPLDGIYIFSSISVGLASGVGHLGVGYLMAGFFCACAAVIFITRYGKRPQAEQADKAKDKDAAAELPAAASAQPPPMQAS
jgi:hypothetical protein